MRKIILGLFITLAGLVVPAISAAQAPPPVPALPDTERLTQYAITAQTGPFDVGFAVYGDGTDYGNWLEVWLDGVMLTPVADWTLALTSGTLASTARPLTNARVTLTTARTGTLEIIGARRPRRTTQFAENQGVSARALNQAITDLVAQNRENWDKINRGGTGGGGGGGSGSGDVVGPPVSTNNAIARFSGSTGKIIRNSLSTISDTGVLSVVSNALGAWPVPTGSDIGLGIGANLSGGQSEVNFINLSTGGAGPRAFAFSQQTAPSAGTDLMWINRNGSITSVVTDSVTTPAALSALLSPYGVYGLGAVTNHARNTIIGITLSESGDGAAFPTGVTGTAIMLNPGGQAFGLFGSAWNSNYDGSGAAFGTITNEVNTFNFKANPPGTYPPNRAFGITQAMPVILTVAAGGAFKSEIGIELGREGSNPQKMNTGVYMDKNGVDLYGLIIDAVGTRGTGTGYVTTAVALTVGQTVIPLITGSGTILAGDIVTFATDPHTYTVATGIAGPGSITLDAPGIRQAVGASQAVTVYVGGGGPNVGAFIRNYGDASATSNPSVPSVNLWLQTVGPMVAANKVIQVTDTGGVDRFYVTQLGAVISTSYVQHTTYTVATLPTCNAASKGARALVSDSTSAAFMVGVVGGGSNTVPVFCNSVSWVTG
jgi:hypothetical protein